MNIDAKALEKVINDNITDIPWSELISAWNDVCDEVRYEERISHMDDLDDYFSGGKFSENLRQLDGDFSIYEEFFYFDGINFKSTNDPMTVVDTQVMAETMLEQESSFGISNDKVNAFIEKYKDSQELPGEER